MKNMNQLMKQAKKMQEDIMKAQEALAAEQLEGTAGGGAVKVTVTGGKEVVAVEINRDVVDPDDVEMLQDLVLAAIQDAMKQADDLANNTLGKYTRGMNMPGLF
jgi:nucleoid-associated protein EbfC